MEVEVNYFGILAAVIVSMVIGATWYSDALFKKQWMKLGKIDEKKMNESSTKAMTVMLLLGFVSAYVLAHVTYLSAQFFTEYTYQFAAISTAFWMWLGFVLPVASANTIFNQAPLKLTVIQAGEWFVAYIAMGITIGVIGI